MNIYDLISIISWHQCQIECLRVSTPYEKHHLQIEQLFKQYHINFSHVNEPRNFNGGSLDLCFSNKKHTNVNLIALWLIIML